MTLLFKICLRGGAIIGIKTEKEYAQEGLELYLKDNRGDSSLVCAYDLAYVFAMMFFTVALFLNAIRWVILIQELQNMEKHKFTRARKVALGSAVVILGIVSVYRMVAECDVEPSTNEVNGLKIPVLVATIVMQTMNIVSLCLFFKASSMN